MPSSLQTYYAEVAKATQFGGSEKETALRTAFVNLINDYAKTNDLLLVPELSASSLQKETQTVIPDGTLKDILRQDWGYWEAKDTDDNLDEEIRKKFNKGYPTDNILFEDTQTAVLFQAGKEVFRCNIADEKKLDALLKAFTRYDKPDVRDFRKALELFKQDVPNVTRTVRTLIAEAEKNNPKFQELAAGFLEICREQIDPEISFHEIREMLVQHILTEDIFNRIFSDNQFHRENNIARELENVCRTFFFGEVKHKTMFRIKHYYDALTAAASRVARHHEKQKILQVIYEAFYRSYNPAAADRLGVIYTPDEIVQFMVRTTDELLQKHFDCLLESENVEILDPCVGTGTFICAVINYIRKIKLEQKYRHEIHANEIAILPYYISNLNIELTYAQKMNDYVPFENLVFADTLDRMNTGYIQPNLGFMEENVKRINRQNERTISVIIGNPPYNANQQNENDNNPNKKYPRIDKRIKETFFAKSKAQKTKLYDPYVRFYRWAFDRIAEDGIVAFVTNRSFIDKKSFDGFRQILRDEFAAVYVIDLGGDARDKNKVSAGSVFGIQVGVAVLFCIKKKSRSSVPCRISYIAVDDQQNREGKLQWLNWLNLQKIEDICLDIRPDNHHSWINKPPKSDFESLLPLCSKEVKNGSGENAVFRHYLLGVSTNRDDWVTDFDKKTLQRKIRFFAEKYNEQIASGRTAANDLDYSIKWSRDLKIKLQHGRKISYSPKKIGTLYYRAFVKKHYYQDRILLDRPPLFADGNNSFIHFSYGHRTSFQTLATDIFASLDMFQPDAVLSLPFCVYGKNNQPVNNITDWGVKQFREHYSNPKLTRRQIFSYIYAVLHHPEYRRKYELNLKRDYPRIPFYADFHQWASRGQKLLALHIGYENAAPYPLQTVRRERKQVAAEKYNVPKTILKANPAAGEIVLDEETKLIGIPKEAWEYKIGKRSALERILDQYKEKKPRDKTVAGKFNTYRFADYKEHVIDLLQKICTVSTETMKILGEMKE